MNKKNILLAGAVALLAACQQQPQRPTYGELKAQRIDSMIEAAQRNIPLLDSQLQAAIFRYEAQKRLCDAHRAALTVTQAELDRLSALRLHRDSLQVRFDTECARVRYLRRKAQESPAPKSPSAE